MNVASHISLSNINTEVVTQQDAATSTSNPFIEDGDPSARSMYETVSWTFNYFVMFVKRLGKDLLQSVLYNVYSERVLPDHIADLIRVHKRFRQECEEHSGTYSHYRLIRRPTESPVIVSENESNLPYMFSNNNDNDLSFVLQSKGMTVLSSEMRFNPKKTLLTKKIDSPSTSKERSIMVLRPQVVDISESHNELQMIDINLQNENKVLNENNDDSESNYDRCDEPSTSKEHSLVTLHPAVVDISESQNILQMMDINLQGENNKILIDNNDDDPESIVISYLRNKDAITYQKHNIQLTNKKKTSLLESVPKMETIIEGKRFFSFLPDKSDLASIKTNSDSDEESNPSDTSLDARIPSFPGSPRSLIYSTESSLFSFGHDPILISAVNFLHSDNEYLHYAETGDDMRLEMAVRRGVNINAVDQLGRTALHFAVQANSIRAITFLLNLGILPYQKDNVGMTPLSLSLMRRPSLQVAKLLFDHGAKLVPRVSPVDTGLFLQFVMMCVPTREDANILRLLIEKGALINDPHVPGGRSALHFAAMSNNCDLIRVLMQLGADLTAVNHRGQTPRDVAVTFKCSKAAELLEEYMDEIVTENCD